MEVTVGAMSPLLRKLGDLLTDEFKLEKQVKRGVISLLMELEMMHAILLKVGQVPPDQLHMEVRIWAEKVRDLSYDMEDAVDGFMVRVEEGGHDGKPTNVKNRVKKFLKKTTRLFTKGKALHQISDVIQEARDQLIEWTKRCDRYMFEQHSTSDGVNIDPRLIAIYKDVTELVGIEEPMDDLIQKLTEGEEGQLKTISIVGFGGLGKTTLAKAVYDKMKVQFDCGAFVSVSRTPDMKKVLKDVMYELDERKFENIHSTAGHEKLLIDELRKFLENKRYLIIIDDMWDYKILDLIKMAFSGNNLGSRLITTTRKVSVSEACLSYSHDTIYTMKPLSGKQSQSLFYRRIFHNEAGCPAELQEVSEGILKKCDGLPLAIITMASVLASNQNMRPKDQWCHLLKSIGHEDIQHASVEEMNKILLFSYYDMPSYLKICLLYFSSFPEDYEIERERLIRMWIANGFIHRTKQETSLEEVASHYVNELIDRNLIQLLECNNNCEVITYHIHPMVHQVLKSIAKQEKFAALLDYKEISSPGVVKFRHLSIDSRDSKNPIYSSSMASHGVHSLTVFAHANWFLLKHFEGIRVLNLEACRGIEKTDLEYICTMARLKYLSIRKTQITELPPQIGSLQLLEGLDVGGTQITELPPQIGNLNHLKRLDARKSGVKELPDEVVQLTKLVHLLVGDKDSSEGVKLPDGIGKLKSLQQLCTIDLTKCSTSCVEELGELTELEELAVVANDGQEERKKNSILLSSLEKCVKLQRLVVYGDFSLNTIQSPPPYNRLVFRKKLTVVRSLKVPMDIAGEGFRGILELDIRVCKLEEDDLKRLQGLPSLQSLTVRFEVLPKTMVRISREGFANLVSFCVDCRMPRVLFEKGAMPKLQDLELKVYAGSASEEPIGIKHLLNLQVVLVRFSQWNASSKGVKATIAAMRIEAKEHQNRITLRIAEEKKDGSYSMRPDEIFQENNDARCSMMTEIEEEEEEGIHESNDIDDNQEGGLHQSSYAIASCSGTNEIEEVVE